MAIAQTAPVISYPSPQIFVKEQAITPITPTNTGGAVTKEVRVTTFAGSGLAGAVDGVGTAASFNNPFGIAIDDFNNLYITDKGNYKVRKITPLGVVSTLSGSGAVGFAGGTSTTSKFSNLNGIAIGLYNIIYVADGYYIREIISSSGLTQQLGDTANGLRIFPQSSTLTGIAIDQLGNYYLGDQGDNKIKKVAYQTTAATTVAGSGNSGFVNGTASQAEFNDPEGLAIDNFGNLYVGDNQNNRIRKIAPNGQVSTLAGNGIAGFADGTAATAQFNGLYGLCLDAAGTIYIADSNNNCIRKINTTGIVSTVAGNHLAAGDIDGTGTAARLAHPSGIAINSLGHLFVTDAANNKIKKITNDFYSISPALPEGLLFDGTTGSISGAAVVVIPKTVFTITASNASGSSSFSIEITVNNSPPPAILYPTPQIFVKGQTINPLVPNNMGGGVYQEITVTTVAGNQLAGDLDGIGTNAKFNYPNGIAIDPAGNLYIADTGNNKIKKVSPTGMVATLAGGINSWGDGTGAVAGIAQVYGIVADRFGTVYITDLSLIRKITPAGVVTTIAGNNSGSDVDGIGTNASFGTIMGIAIDPSGNLYVTDASNNKIKKMTPAGVVSTLAGSGTPGFADGKGGAASFNYPRGIATDILGNIYVGDEQNHKIRKITPNGQVTTLAGSGVAGFMDGTSATAKFSYPTGLCVDVSGNVFVADSNNDRVRKISPSGIVSTVIGATNYNGGKSYIGDVDGSGTIARFSYPSGIVTDAYGNFFVADAGNHKIKKIIYQYYSISPALPAGLLFDTTTGVISGTPTATMPKTTFTITAPNTNGSSSFDLEITVIDPLEPDDDTDGIANNKDNCPEIYNPNQEDVNKDGIGDVCQTEDLVIFNSFTPNGDGSNDMWKILNIEKYPNTSVRVFNRWGQVVFFSKDYKNNWNGNELPRGTYFYIVTTNGDKSKEYKGWLYIAK